MLQFLVLHYCKSRWKSRLPMWFNKQLWTCLKQMKKQSPSRNRRFQEEPNGDFMTWKITKITESTIEWRGRRSNQWLEDRKQNYPIWITKKNRKKKEQSARNLYNCNKRSNICFIWVLGRWGERRQGCKSTKRKNDWKLPKFGNRNLTRFKKLNEFQRA